jgi:hypothetical protein
MTHLNAESVAWLERLFWWLVIAGNVAFLVALGAKCIG